MHADAQTLAAGGAQEVGEAPRAPRPYTHPYLAGFGLGLVLLTAFVVMGRGLGASGAFSSVIVGSMNAVVPAHAQGNAFYSEYLDSSRSPFMDWLVFEVLGVFVGGFISGMLAGRFKKEINRGPAITSVNRLVFAFVGGGILGFGAKLARGCMSGQALTGGALLNVGSWAAMMCIFAGAYAMAYFVRRQWQ